MYTKAVQLNGYDVPMDHNGVCKQRTFSGPRNDRKSRLRLVLE